MWKNKEKYIKNKKKVIKLGNHSELLIERPDGKDRCSLIITSYDNLQLKNIKESLENRGRNSRLLENFRGGGSDFKFNLMPEVYKGKLNILEDFNNFIEFVDKYFAYGKPVKDLDFFTKEEKEMLTKWYK